MQRFIPLFHAFLSLFLHSFLVYVLRNELSLTHFHAFFHLSKVWHEIKKVTFVNKATGCEITVGHRTCPINVAQSPIEKQFILLNIRAMSVENLFVVKP